MTGILLSLHCLSQPSFQGSIQQGPTLNSVNITYLPNHNSVAGEYVNYLSISIAIPSSSATGIIPTITGVDKFASLTFVEAVPFSYTSGTETIFSWICANGTPFPMSFSNAVPFTGATISFCGGTGTSKVRLIDFSNQGGGSNQNTFFGLGVNVSPFDLTNYTDLFYSIADPNGSTEGVYGNGDKYVETNLPIYVTCVLCPSPGTPVVIPGTTTADISWNSVSGATYEYIFSPTPITPGTGTSITTNSYSASGLTPGTQYYICVRTVCGLGFFSEWSCTSFTTNALNCSNPSTPSVQSITNTSATINWTGSGAVSYEYVLSTSSAPPVGAGTSTPGPSLNLTTLTPGTNYCIFIRSYCGFGYFSNWVSTCFTTVCPSPAIPTVNNITPAGADITWNAVAGVTGYEYAITTSSTAPGSGTSTTATAFTASGLSCGTQYYFHLRSKCSPGIFSSWVSTSFTTICPTPTVPTVTGITLTGATINWTADNCVILFQYVVTQSSTPPVSGTATQFTTAPITNLLTGATYYVYVRSDCGSGIFSGWSQTTFNTICPPPIFINIVDAGDTTNISWGALVDPGNGYEYAITLDSLAPASGTETPSTSVQLTGLQSSTTYYVFVRSICSLGVFSPWFRKSFTTTCFKPDVFVFPNQTTTSTTKLGWHKIPGAIKYEYAILNTGGSPGGSLLTTSDTAMNVTNLKPGGKYYLHVRTHCGVASISDWAVLEFNMNGINAFPSPVENTLTIIVYGITSGNDVLNMYDANGRMVKTMILNGNRADIDMRRFASGMYFIRYKLGTTIYTAKVVKR